MKSFHRVFVYGTLKQNGGNHRLLVDSTFLGEAVTVAESFRMMSTGGFPVITESHRNQPRAAAVTGEVYLVTDETLAQLDRLEGIGVMYRRERIKVVLGDKIVIAYAYIGIGKCWRYQMLPQIEPVNGQLTWDNSPRYYRFEAAE